MGAVEGNDCQRFRMRRACRHPGSSTHGEHEPPATRRDGWVYEQGRLAERDARAPGSVAAAAPASTSTIGYC
ncbi:MAG: hypothetical protein LBJ15_18510 [Comamonas sp.]|uniref:hypothetical protein n=1 Tax=Comamonas sp. TaxID=34028 RepID=UPI00283880F9|nr:hypothetical protein [Comamonas sp.]MDR0215970.1 hypothetical protein [Comamonas sp.]